MVFQAKLQTNLSPKALLDYFFKSIYSFICGCVASPLLYGFSVVAVHRLLIPGASLLWSTRIRGLQLPASRARTHGLSCSVAYEIFSYQGLKPCLLHGQVDSLLLSHQ